MTSGRLHNKISKLQRSFKKDDPPPERVKPIPIPLLCHMAENNQHSVHSRAVADCGIIGLYYLICPREYTYAKDNDHPFRLEDVSFLVPPQTINAITISREEINAATKCHLDFTDQKNGEKGEAITHGDNNELLLSPLKAVQWQIEHLR